MPREEPRKGESPGRIRRWRGRRRGAWNNTLPSHFLSSYLLRNAPQSRLENNGFRVVLAPMQ